MGAKGFPGGTMGKNLPANAGDMGLIPGPGRFHMPRNNPAHMSKLLSLHSRAQEPQQEKPPQLESHALQLEKACATTKTLHNHRERKESDGG